MSWGAQSCAGAGMRSAIGVFGAGSGFRGGGGGGGGGGGVGCYFRGFFASVGGDLVLPGGR